MVETGNPLRPRAMNALLFIRCVPVVGLCLICQTAEGGSAEARQAWESAVEAKGGRAQLNNVRSVLLTETTTWGYRSLRPKKYKYTTLLVPPFRMWSWVDERPNPKFGLKVRTVNTETGFAQITYHDDKTNETPNPVGEPNVSDKRRIRQLQLLTFLETAWVRPRILRSWKAHDWFIPIIVVETEVEGEVYEWYFDSLSFLPRRVIAKVPVPPYGVSEEEFRLEDYRLVDGLQLPHRITHGRFREQIEYKLNVDYDETIFHRAPSPAAGRDAWMRKAPSVLRERE